MRSSWALGILTAAAVGLSLVTIRVAWERPLGATIIWSDEEALLLAPAVRDGFEGSALAYALQLVRNAIGLHTQLTTARQWLTVVEVRSDGVTTYLFDPETATTFWVVDGRIVTATGPELRRWSGVDFTRVPEAERQRLEARPWDRSAQFDNVEGWSKRSNVFFTERGSFHLYLAGEHVVVTATSERFGENATIDVRLPREPPRQVWSIGEHGPRYVSGAEFERLFRP